MTETPDETTLENGFRPLRLSIVDNDPLTLSLLVKMVPRWIPGSQIIWFTQSGGDAARRCLDPELAPDILMLDMSLNDEESGLDVCRLIRMEDGAVPLLGITSFSLAYYAEKLAHAGAQGLATKSDSSMITLAVNQLRKGGTFSPVKGVRFDTAADAYERLMRAPKSEQPKLSAQESRVLDMLSRGLRYAQIAEDFGVTESSVRTQAHRAVKKLNASTLSQAIALWVTGAWK